MSRALNALNRIALGVIGLVLTLIGLAMLWWWLHLDRGAPALGLAWPQRLDLGPVTSVLDRPWWPWVSAVAGLLLLLLGVRWALAHLAPKGVARLRLPASQGGGRLSAESGAVTSAAAEALERAAGVRNASGRLVHERGQIVARMAATIDPRSDLPSVAEGVERFSRELHQVLGRDDVHLVVTLGSARTSTAPRAR